MLDRMQRPPAPVQTLIKDWRRRGSPSQPGVDWNRPLWVDKFLAYKSFLEDVPVPLDRTGVQSRFEKLRHGELGTEEAFLLSMVWGYGVTGYGWWRAKRVFDQNPNIGPRLTEVGRMLHIHDGPPLAYEALATDHKLKFLGPAFGTKYLYFCSASERRPALILDLLVAKWLRVNTTLVLDPVTWNPVAYAQWLDYAYSWADSLNVRPDELESCIFENQYNKQKTRQAANSGLNCKTPVFTPVHKR